MTPEPRLSERRSLEPKKSSSPPKKYRKKGSLSSGVARVRTTCSDEMLATPLTACPATRVKSSPLAAIADGAAMAAVAVGEEPPFAAWEVSGAGAADAGAADADAIVLVDELVDGFEAVCARPVITTPAMNPATTSTADITSRRIAI